MKTTKHTEFLQSNACPSACHGLAVNHLKRFAALCIGTLFLAGALSWADAQIYSTNAVGLVSDMTTQLLTAPLPPAQQKLVHAQNFNQLAPGLRPLYLFAVAFDVGIMAGRDGTALSSTELAQYLQSLTSIYQVPAIPPEDSQLAAAQLAVVKIALRELNTLITAQISNNAGFQQAMYAGAVDSFYDWDLWF